MAIKGLNLTSTEPYELSFDDAKGTQDATVFTIGTLDSRIIGRIRDTSSTLVLDRAEDELQTNVNMNEMNYLWVQYGLRGWVRFYDEDGSLIPFTTSTETIGGIDYSIVAPATLRRVPDEAIKELAAAIQARNTLTKAEAKNSAI